LTLADLQRAARGRAALALALLVASAALLASPLRGHVDDTDAQLYQTLSRNMAARGAWLEPGPPPGSLQPFREHLPFGLWPQVAAVRILGEGALFLPGLVFSAGTVLLVFLLGARLASPRAGAAAALLLAFNETFFLYGARPRLDPPLVFFALLAAAPALLGRLRGGGLVLAAAAGGVAALIKGPFGLVPLAAAGGAHALIDALSAEKGRRSGLGRALLELAAALTLAALPALAFLLLDRARDGTWWAGYVRHQMLASAEGTRRDGEMEALFPFASVAGRFWPGLPAVLLGLWQSLALPLPAWLQAGTSAEKQRLRLLAAAAALALCALTLPGRKVWNHELVAYPLLALLGGVATDPFLLHLSTKAARGAVVALGALACAFALLGLGVRLLQPPCVGSREFAARLSALPPGTPVLLAGAPVDWHTHAGLAAEHHLEPWPVAELPAEPALAAGESSSAAGPSGSAAAARHRALGPRLARLALREDRGSTPPPAPWRVVGSARGWQLLER
jgi:4-amino-4-deoxy-L-arabinose transferase-like glycosyltransferase